MAVPQKLGMIQWGGLLMGPGTGYHVSAISGIDDLPDVRNSDVAKSDAHGDYTGPDYVGPRVVQISLTLIADDPDTLRQMILDLRRATQPSQQPDDLQLLDWGVSVSGKVRKRSVPYDAEQIWRTGTAAIEWYCADPYLYGLTEHTATTSAYSPSAGRTYPLAYAGVGPAVRNLVLNPSFETSFTTETTGFGTNSTRSRVSTDSYIGQYSVQHDISTASSQGGTTWNIEPQAAGTTIQWATYVRIPTTGISALELWWRNGTTNLSTTSVLAQAVPGTWTRVSGTYTVAAGQTCDRVSAVATTSAAGAASWWADAALAVAGAASLPSYFDGANGGTWEGTPHASVSARPAGVSRMYGSSGSSGTVTCANNGDSPAYPVLRLDGPVANPSVEQPDLGALLVLDATVNAGEYVLIDTRSRAVLYNGTTPRRDFVRGGSSWPLLVPGDNALTYRGSALPGAPGQSSLLTVTWRDTSL